MSLSREVDKHLRKQAKLDEESEKIVNLFLKEHVKKEVYEVLGYIETSGSPKHVDIINNFIKNYEENNLNVKDIKLYLTVFKLNKDAMKETRNGKNKTILSGGEK